MFKPLYDIVRQFKEYVLFSLFVAGSIGLLAVNDSPQIRAVRSGAILALGGIQDAIHIIPNYFDLRRENRALRELNLTLMDEVSRLREARLENIRLRQAVGLPRQPDRSYIAADIVGKTTALLRNTITLNVGDRDGVTVNMPVVSERGLVGKIVATSSHYSVGQILFNRDLRISAKIQRSRVDGIVRWDGGRSMTLQNVVKTADVQAGDLVITSGYSSTYPGGLPIGIVSSARLQSESLFQTVELTPVVDFTRLEEVFVVATVPDTSRATAETRARLEPAGRNR
jgi:rod shape-determining protein MreC